MRLGTLLRTRTNERLERDRTDEVDRERNDRELDLDGAGGKQGQRPNGSSLLEHGPPEAHYRPPRLTARASGS